jgi:N-acetylmuramoyl-L-alanine amidase
MARLNSVIAKIMTPKPARTTVPIGPLVVAVAAAVLASCGGPPKQPTLDRLYRGLSESLPRIDPSILAGRRILIDPGHGGQFRGTVGPDSLEEAHVNLGVSLYLWGLLQEAGADARLTRAIDRDFLTEADSSLASDLRTRVWMADSLQPDILVSIHHNAHPLRDPSRNSVETYYRAGDPASLDLGFAIHRHLIRNLGIDTGEVRQGNYLILRETSVPAVLGESSYLTHPSVEDRLKLSETQKLEAEAYFLGILEYFQRGIPRVTCVSPADSVYETVPELVYTLVDDGGSGIDPDGIFMTLNGRRVAAVVDPLTTRASYRPPWDLANGSYAVSMSVRNVGGNTSPVLETRFLVDLPPEFASFEISPAPAPRLGRAVRARVRLLDRRGMPVADGTGAFLTTSGQADTVWAVVSDGSIDAAVPAAGGSDAVTLYVGCRGKRFETSIGIDPEATVATRAYHIRDAITGRPVEEARVSLNGAGRSASRTGTFVHGFPAGAASTDSAASILSIDAPGYVPVVVAGVPPSDTVFMQPWFGGALTGLRFVVDPEGGRASVSGIGPLGLSGAHANLQVARYLTGYLRAAGARVLLTRTNDEVRTPEDIARLTNRFGANRYLEIRHRSAPADSPLVVTTYHFPGSATGALLAASVVGEMSARLEVPGRGPYETVTYPLQQTACPAIVIAAPSIGSLEEELRLAQSWYQREQAYAIFLGVLDHYDVSDSGQLLVRFARRDPTVEGIEAGAAVPDAAGWRVTVEGSWTLVTGADGAVWFDKLPPGDYRISAVKSGRSFGDVVRIAPGQRAAVWFPPGDD